jgi:hypothetical protein
VRQPFYAPEAASPALLGEIGSQSVEIYLRLSDLCGAR